MISIAIDGPAGAGKSTVARAVAKKLSFIYVDTGSLYRAIGLFMIQNGINEESEIIGSLKKIQIDLRFENFEQKVFLCNKDVSKLIRTPEISMMASKVSAICEVREFLLKLQQDLAKKNNVIMDGRDIGTVILPNANVKIFLTATSEKRAQRRCKELLENGFEVTYNEVLKDIIKRDTDDSNRTVAPLKPAKDAIIIDTSEYNLESAVSLVIEAIENKLKSGE